MLIIPDVSFYQDNNATPRKIDFHKMKVEGAAGVIIRAGQNTWIDPDFKDNWRAAKEAGLPRGTYWFWDSRSSPVKQADLWYSVIDDMPEIGAWMDFEESYNGSYGTEGHMRDFAERVLSLFSNDVEVGVYTAYYWWIKRVSVSPLYWAKFPLWIANYGVSKPMLPKPFTSWVFWQYTSSGDGLKYGAESKEIDLNYFDGDHAAFYSMFGIGEPPKPEHHKRIVIEIVGDAVYKITEE